MYEEFSTGGGGFNTVISLYATDSWYLVPLDTKSLIPPNTCSILPPHLPAHLHPYQGRHSGGVFRGRGLQLEHVFPSPRFSKRRREKVEENIIKRGGGERGTEEIITPSLLIRICIPLPRISINVRRIVIPTNAFPN